MAKREREREREEWKVGERSLKTLPPRSLFGFNLEVAGARPPAGLAGQRGKHRCLCLAPAESPTLAGPRRCPWRPRL